FLASAGMFKHPIAGFLFRHLYCIPIMRPGKDEKVKKVSNKESFRKSFDHLAKGGVMFIAPEGGSAMERRLRPLKTGTARIALGAEEDNDFQLGIHLYPTGITYEHPTQCGSRVYIEAGEPIQVADWKEAYLKNPKEAVRDLTCVLEERMEALIIHTGDEEQDQLLYRLETILRNDRPLPVDQHYQRSQRLLTKLQSTDKKNYVEVKEKANHYRDQLKANQLTDRGISQQDTSLFSLINLLGWPVWLYGRINNLFPYELPRLLAKKLDLYIGYNSTVKILSGTILFPLFYFIQYKLFSYFVDGPWPLIYLLSLPLSGIGAWLYARHFVPRWEAFQWKRWQKKHPKPAKELLHLRAELSAYASTVKD
ncbi:MAG: 1-acyl-sn-glycerol-3-phosphate acyltransferase, partial [Bacteroidota bacterium]